MTHDEIIAVIIAHKNGKSIEASAKGKDCWYQMSNPKWNFSEYNYRIAEPRWRDATIDDLKRAPMPCRVRGEDGDKWRHEMLRGYDCKEPSWLTMAYGWYEQCQVIDE